MDNGIIESKIEAILFAAGEPVSVTRISTAIGITEEEVLNAAKSLSGYYSFTQRGISLVLTDDNLQLCSSPEYAEDVIHALERRRPPKLSQPALEVMAICAYFQPVTRAYIEKVRGVDSSYTIGMLIERGIIENFGRLDVIGKPVVYRTTDLFLRTMGITALSDLPELPDLAVADCLDNLNAMIKTMKTEDNIQLSSDDKQDLV